MNGNIVKLVFDCISKGSGWADLRKNAADSLKNMHQLGGAFKSVAISAGAMGGVIGRAISAFAMGNVWGLAAEGMRFAIEKLGIFKDKSEETKKKLDELKTETEKFYSTITDNYEKAKGKLDKETEVRKAQLEITNRMIKAEMELRRAKALSSGDVGTANAIEDEMSEQDGRTDINKANIIVNAAEKRAKQAENNLKAAQKAEHDAISNLDRVRNDIKESHWKDYQRAYKYAGGRASRSQFDKGFRYSEDDLKSISVVEKIVESAERATDAAVESVAEERRKLQLARQNLEVLKKEQEAAKAKAKAEKDAAEAKQKANAKKAKEDADKKFLEEAKAQQVKYENEERDRKKRQAKEEAEEKKRKLREFEAEKIREEMRTNRATAANYEQTLSDAIQRVADKRDILKNAADMDQAGDIESENQAKHVEERYAKRREALQKRLDRVGGDASKLGRLSNIDKAVLDRMGAEKVKDSATEELKELNKKFEKLSQRLEAATQL